ncbi:cytochrome c biogenesis protein CcsA-like [Amaranthus tricolor]|uniref:cytochrome c biogenesis protein CcsA-like n=1 Tax=Amaranthus tricolor TaxID=29722 RepID=UPI00258DDB7D|nr:cytochrome c biogenesis protein CcsA-like [Amaranthus tricolor]
MAVPKKRTSIYKKRIRKNLWKKKGHWAALKAFSLAKSIATGNSKRLLITRWVYWKHLPLSDLYESLIFLSWSFYLSHLIPYFLKKDKNSLSAITAPSAILTQGFATSGFLTEMHQSAILVPALQSQWLMMHEQYGPMRRGDRIGIGTPKKLGHLSLGPFSYNLDMLFWGQSIRNRAT